MTKQMIILLSLVLIAGKVFSDTYVNKPKSVRPQKIGGAGALPPRWLAGVTVYNKTDKPIEVKADGGTIDYVKILPGETKLVKSEGHDSRGVYWMQNGFEYETPKYQRPDYMVVKSYNVFDMHALDKIVSKGSWQAVESVPYLNQEAKITKKPE